MVFKCQLINDYIKCKWLKYTHKETEIFSVSKEKTQFNCTLIPETLYSKAQRSLRKKTEKDTPRTMQTSAEGKNGASTTKKSLTVMSGIR